MRRLACLAALAIIPLAVHAQTPGSENPLLAQLDWANALGPFHVVLLHFPISFVALAGLLEAAQLVRPRLELRRFVTLTLGISAASAWAAVVTGLCRGAGGEFVGENFSQHRLFGIALAVLATAALFLRVWTPNSLRRQTVSTFSSRLALALSVGCLGLAGHFGGTLTHGEGFLTKGFSAPSSKATAVASTAPSASALSNDAPKAAQPSSNLYETMVAPALKQKCVGCHGPDKQKGGLRLDSIESLLAETPQHPPMVIPHEPLKSRLVEILLLPNDAEDHMPPQGKAALNSDEILAVVHWISEGALVASAAK